MGPKPLPKRRGREDDSSPARHAKRAGKNKREITYDTYEEAMDGGVEYEEKGERYRDGERSQRNYERALELYRKANEMQQTYDAAYNQARVLYTLATAFLLPPTAISYLSESIELYRHAMTLTESPLLRLDAGFNLAQSCSTLADVQEDVGEGSSALASTLNEEAREKLEVVMQGQEEYLASLADEEDVEATEEVVDGMEAGAGQDASTPTGGMNIEGTENGAEGDGTTYETHLPTPSSLIDTVLALVEIHLTLWTSLETLQPPDEAQQIAVRSILDRAAGWCPPGRQAELDLAEMKVLLTMDGIIWDLFKSQATVGSGSLQSLEGASNALGRLFDSLDTQSPDEPTIRAEILSTLAECHTKIANRSIILSSQLPPGPSPLAQQAWYHHSQAITVWTKALELPTTPDTPREFRPSVLLELSKSSLARARLALVNETAQRNLAQLVENASTYAARAGDGLGLPWIKLENAITQGTKADIPLPRGWDMEALGREVIMQQVRVCLYASEMDLSIVVRGKLNEGMSKLFDLVKSLPEERRVSKRDIQRWVEDLEDEEGLISEVEKGWWDRVAVALGAMELTS